MGGRPLGDWYQEFVLDVSMTGSMVRLNNMFRNQLILYFYVSENMVPSKRGLDKRHCKLFYVLQMRIELPEDRKSIH